MWTGDALNNSRACSETRHRAGHAREADDIWKFSTRLRFTF